MEGLDLSEDISSSSIPWRTLTSRQTPTTDRQSHNQKRETARQYKSRELAVEILHWMDDPWPPTSNDFRNAEVSFLRERVCGLNRQLPRGGGVGFGCQ